MAFNILYKGRKIYKDLSYEDCMEVLDNLSQEYYQDENYDVNEIELEEI
jgi:Lhr-like helicase